MTRFEVLVAVFLFCGAYAQQAPCEFPMKALDDIRATKEKINTLIIKLRTYAVENGLPIPTEPVEPTDAPVIDDVSTKEPEPTVFRTCKDLLDYGYTTDGIYDIVIDGTTPSVPVYCDMNTDLGGWIVIQRRMDGSVDFNRTFDEYAAGFGDLSGEFWLGNDLLNVLTSTIAMELRIDMTDFDDVAVFAKYGKFAVGTPAKNYRLTVGGVFDGEAGNSLSYHNKSPFSTFDVDNDASPSRNCALRHNGGWWFKNCMRSNLNGFYFPSGPHESYADGIEWSRFRGLKYSLKFTEMKIRPVAIQSNEI